MASKADSRRLVVVSPRTEDHACLREILRHSPWEISEFVMAADGLNFLRGCDYVAAVICEESLPDGDWRFVLREVDQLPVRPSFIVSSRLADERLWAEALNLGADDVLLAAPFEVREVTHVMESAWISWNHAREQRPVPRKATGSASPREMAPVQAPTAVNSIQLAKAFDGVGEKEDR